MYNLAREIAKLEKLGVAVSVKRRRTPEEKDKTILAGREGMTPASDGLILRVENDTPCSFALVVEAPDRKDLAVVLIEGRRSEMLTKLSPVKTENGKNSFVRLVSTHQVHGGYSTMPQDNSLRIVSVRRRLLQILSVAVTTRLYDEEEMGAFHFLVIQEMYRAKLYRDVVNKIVAEDIVTSDQDYPGFNNWDVMQMLVDDMVAPDARAKLPLLCKRCKGKSEQLALSEGQARVIFFDINKGFGFAETHEGSKYFNWKDSPIDRLPFFESGQIVGYDSVINGPQGERLVGLD